MRFPFLYCLMTRKEWSWWRCHLKQTEIWKRVCHTDRGKNNLPTQETHTLIDNTSLVHHVNESSVTLTHSFTSLLITHATHTLTLILSINYQRKTFTQQVEVIRMFLNNSFLYLPFFSLSLSHVLSSTLHSSMTKKCSRSIWTPTQWACDMPLSLSLKIKIKLTLKFTTV